MNWVVLIGIAKPVPSAEFLSKGYQKFWNDHPEKSMNRAIHI